MKKLLSIIIPTIAIMVSSCTSSGVYMPNVSGAAFEVLLVIDNDIYRTPAGETMFNIINADVPHLPQSEPMFKMSRIEHSLFDNLFRTTRNIIFVTVDSTKYTKANMKLSRDKWAKTQAIAEIYAPDTESLKAFLEGDDSKRLTDFLVKAERERMIKYYKSNKNKDVLRMINNQFGCNVIIPTSLNKVSTGKDFLWATNGNMTGTRQDFIIYTTPYTSEQQLTHESIIARRDSVLKVNIPGGVEGSHMGTELRYEPPTTETVTINKKWAAETRGLWKMINGESMGGPFVSLTRIDEFNMRIVTVEGFVFAPGKEKRNSLRQMDAIVYSLLLPQEINTTEVTVTQKEENIQK